MIASAKGGRVPIDPKSIQEQFLAATSRDFLKDGMLAHLKLHIAQCITVPTLGSKESASHPDFGSMHVHCSAMRMLSKRAGRCMYVQQADWPDAHLGTACMQ